MIYNQYQDKQLSALGMGCMRLPCSEQDNSAIDMEATKEMVEYAISHGINYFDTAWGYHDGKSEIVMGEILQAYPRDRFFLASKFPGYDLRNMDKVEEIFEQQLKKCGVSYFDFYMFHNVCEANIDAYLDPAFGIYDYLIKQKQNGRIRHLGFSAHGNLNTMQRFLDAYGNDMEFCQIQLNWLDWSLQSAEAKVKMLNNWNIPVWVMEPLRGGSLVKLAQEHEAQLRSLQPEWSMPEWSFRFLQNIPGVTMTLSGMSNSQQLQENIAIYENDQPFTETERSALFAIAREALAKKTLPCTACRYCTTHCPMELNIPLLIELYNEHSYSNGGFIAPMVLGTLPEDKKPSACVGCRACEAVCPQNIRISEMMSDFTSKMNE